MARYPWLAPAVFILASCGKPTPKKLSDAIDDCRIRAKATGGDYSAAFKVCLMDRHNVERKLADLLGEAEYWRDLMTYQRTAQERAESFKLYKTAMFLAQVRGADKAWVDSTVRRDSLTWIGRVAGR